MEALVDKLTTYEIFTNLFPGVVFVYFLDYLFGIVNSETEIFVVLIISYLLGMFLSRVSSLFIEPLFQKFKIIEKVKYEDYVKAELKEKECKTTLYSLVEKGNIYRTLVVMFGFMFFIYLFYSIYISNSVNFLFLLIFIIFILVFSFAYIKQVKYIVKRVTILLN